MTASDDSDDVPRVHTRAPDDARELAADVAAYHRELGHQHRRQRWQQWWQRRLFTRRWERYGLSGPLVALVLLVVACVGSLLVVLAPRPPRPPTPDPLAADVPTLVGRSGGLLPDSVVDVAGTARPLRALRPAVLVLADPGCDCAGDLDRAAQQSASYGVRMYAVGRSMEEALQLADASGHNVSTVVDAGGSLTRAFAVRDLTLVLVHSDGVVDDVLRGEDASAELARGLPGLARPGGSSG